jgi:hypothetical protein
MFQIKRTKLSNTRLYFQSLMNLHLKNVMFNVSNPLLLLYFYNFLTLLNLFVTPLQHRLTMPTTD